MIAFIGSVFSPWYRWSGRADPEDHVCVNVVTYGPGGRWCMTDRGRAALRQTAERLEIGPSSLTWRDGMLTIAVDEVSTPHGQRMRGTIRLRTHGVADVEVPLTGDGAHIWRPLAPAGRIEVDLDRPGWRWSGEGYLDSNFGTRALEADFSYWTWGRFPMPGGAVTFYDATRRDGSDLSVALRFRDGAAERVAAPPVAALPRSGWRVRRETRCDADATPRQVQPMLDAPFYCRSAVETVIDGHATVGVHEALDLDRFRGPWLMPMLACRVPRRAGWRRPG